MNHQFESLLKDADLVEEIRDRAAGGRLSVPAGLNVSGDAVERVLESASAPAPSRGVEAPPLERAAPAPPIPPMPGAAEEAIVLTQGRPTLLVQNGTFTPPDSRIWRNVLRLHRTNVENAIARVGRIELHNHFSFDWAGTGWIIADDIVVTNRHVAELFSTPDGSGGFAFASNVVGATYGAQVDFREEFQIPVAQEIRVDEILYVAGADEPDIALLKIASDQALPDPLPLSDVAVADRQEIGVIGYPAFDSRNGLDDMRRLFQDIYDVKRLAPGKVSFPTPNEHYFVHDCTTLGGSSGSVVVDLASGQVVGLHFAGTFLQGNFAVRTDSIKRALASLSASVSVPAPAEPEAIADGRHDPGFFAGRDGYQANFLGDDELAVLLPGLGGWQDDIAAHDIGNGESSPVLDYRHFSVAVSSSRKLPLFTAVNINGLEARRAFRSNDKWFVDLRIDEDLQLGNEIYKHNELDRGHMVRRLDPVWGTREEAQEANDDTFHYVNAAPQHKDLNRRDWVDLEDHILDSAKAKDLKVSVFTGPVFRDSDRDYRGLVQLPEEFWKIAVLINADTDKLSAAGYVLSQGEIIKDVTEAAFVFGEFRTYQVQISKIEEATGLDFGKLKDVDALAASDTQEALALPRVRLIRGAGDLVF